LGKRDVQTHMVPPHLAYISFYLHIPCVHCIPSEETPIHHVPKQDYNPTKLYIHNIKGAA